MSDRIEVATKEGQTDARANRIKKDVDALGIHVNSLERADVYTIDREKSFAPAELDRLGREIFADPITQRYSVNAPIIQATLGSSDNWVIEIGYKPRLVTDNPGKTSRQAIENLLKVKFGEFEGVYTSEQILLKGVKKEDAEKLAKGIANEVVQGVVIYKADEKPQHILIPKITEYEGKVRGINLDVSDEELMKISKERVLALNLDEMKVLAAYAKDPEVRKEREKMGLGDLTDVEVESFAQTQSEHCKHKIFSSMITYRDDKGKTRIINSLFDTYIKRATNKVRQMLGEDDFCVSVFSDNAGVIKFDDKNNLVFKIETHNTPSALDPYGGALTGIVGVNRDPFGTGKGANYSDNVYLFMVGNQRYAAHVPFRKTDKRGQLFPPDRILEGVRLGVEHGGNKSGIPTSLGAVRIDKYPYGSDVWHDIIQSYMGKPIIYVGTIGCMPAEINGEPSHKKKANPGDLIFVGGGRVGKDGIHGATFSSEELHEGSPTTAVQIGDPITQRKLYDFTMEARDLGLYQSITDNGAGGISCSFGEMAKEAGGFEAELAKSKLKYTDLDPWEIFVSEAQERMTYAVKRKNVPKFLELAKKHHVELTLYGEFTDSGIAHIKYKGKTVMHLPMEFLHEGLPQRKMEAGWTKQLFEEPEFEQPEDLTPVLYEMLSRPNIRSREDLRRQYDHEVQGGSVIKPLVGADSDTQSPASVKRPILNSMRGYATAFSVKPEQANIDPYFMAVNSADETIRKIIAAGGDPDKIALLDNFCWSNPEHKERLGQLVRACEGIHDAAIGYRAPLISGKDSMKNEFVGYDANNNPVKISIPPTLLVSGIGIVDDVRNCVTIDAKIAGDLVYVLGKTTDDLGASEYFALMGAKEGKAYIGNSLPKTNLKRSNKLNQALREAIKQGIAASCHVISDGGLGKAASESAFAGNLGMEIDLKKLPYSGEKRDDFALFSESGKYVVTIDPAKREEFERLMGRKFPKTSRFMKKVLGNRAYTKVETFYKDLMGGNIFNDVGTVTDNYTFTVKGRKGNYVVNAPVQDLKAPYKIEMRNTA